MGTTPSPADRLLALSEEMLAAAKAAEWDRLVSLEKTRLPLFQQVFAQGVAGKAGLARQVLALDEQTKSLAEAGMPALRDALVKLRNSGRASSAYRNIQGCALPMDK